MGKIKQSPVRQAGVVMFVAMIVLVVMALVGIAMVRQSGTGLSIAGNVALKQAATSGADLGTEAAYAWWAPLRGQAALYNDSLVDGYFSDWGPANSPRRTGDPTKYDWDHSVEVSNPDESGNTVQYIIERLCEQSNASPQAPGQLCVSSEAPTGKNMSGSTCSEYPNAKVLCEGATAIHYRISTRAKGPKNTVSYLQVMVE